MAKYHSEGTREPNLLSIPYDVRLLIYAHLFPSEPQIYLAATRIRPDKVALYPMHAREDLAMPLCRVSKKLNAEVAEHVYNTYLFNVVGTKKDVLAVHRGISIGMEKYARTEVKVEVLDNGPLSSTACVSIYVTGGRVQLKAERRQRGVVRNLGEVEEEVASMSQRSASPLSRWISSFTVTGAVMISMAVGVAVTAVCVGFVVGVF